MSVMTSSSTATEFRLALQEALAPMTGLPVVAGRVDGAVRQRSVCCVYPLRRARVPDNALQEDVTLVVRCWLKWRDQKDPDRPVDPAALEELSQALLVGLSDLQTQLGPWFIDVVSISFDVEAQGIEATVVGRQDNPFAMCEGG